MHHPTDKIAHTTAFVIPVVEHWLEREIAQWVYPMKDRLDDPSHHERTLLPRSYISLPYASDAWFILCTNEIYIGLPCFIFPITKGSVNAPMKLAGFSTSNKVKNHWYRRYFQQLRHQQYLDVTQLLFSSLRSLLDHVKLRQNYQFLQQWNSEKSSSSRGKI